MPNYISPNPPNVAYNGNETTWWIPVKNIGPQAATNVKVTITLDKVNALQIVTHSAPRGTFDKLSGVWTVGNLAVGEELYLKLVTKVMNIGMAPYTISYVVTGNNVDPNNVNNSGQQTLTLTLAPAVALANDDSNKCSCVNVSENDTACNIGNTEWRIQAGSIVNSDTYTWNATTGEGRFTHKNPFLPITFSYNIYCDVGSGYVQTAGPALVTIPAMFDSPESWNHSFEVLKYVDLSPADLLVISNSPEYGSMDASKYCWRILRNVLGTPLSVEPVICNESVDTRTFFVCVDVVCTPDSVECPCALESLPGTVLPQLPIGYTEQKGDTIVIQHPFAESVWVYDGTGWVRNNCGCIAKTPAITSVDITGDNTKTLTITFADGSEQSTTFQIPTFNAEWQEFHW